MTRPKRLHPGLALTTLAALGLAISLVAARAVGSGQGKHLGQENKSHDDEGAQGEQGHGRGHRAYRFDAREREIISGYYANPGRGLPPGLAKRGGDLPPGLEKQLVRNGTLPPGLQKRLEPLPAELERGLPPLPTECGCRRGVIGTDVVLVRTGNNFILDVLHISGR